MLPVITISKEQEMTKFLCYLILFTIIHVEAQTKDAVGS